MNDQQVVAALLQFYKQQGIDQHYVLDDPIFVKLPTQAKVQALKEHAQLIVDGTTPGFNRLDRNALITKAIRLGVNGALAGAGLGAAIQAVERGTHRYTAPAIGATAGLFAGATSSLIGSYQQLKAKQAVRNQLQATANNPTDSNAIGALSIQGINARNAASVRDLIELAQNATERAIAPETLHGILEQHVQNVEKVNATKQQLHALQQLQSLHQQG